MRSFTIRFILLLMLAPCGQMAGERLANKAISPRQSSVRQLLAVRGEITKIKSQAKAILLMTIRPAKEFAEVTVVARENDFVGSAVGRAGDVDLFGLLADDSPEDETITAAELGEGDVVTVIYDPQLQNRALEIYRH